MSCTTKRMIGCREFTLEQMTNPGETKWLIWSIEHKAWWAPHQQGYRHWRRDAGRYTFEAAVNICREANIDPVKYPNEAMVPDFP